MKKRNVVISLCLFVLLHFGLHAESAGSDPGVDYIEQIGDDASVLNIGD